MSGRYTGHIERIEGSSRVARVLGLTPSPEMAKTFDRPRVPDPLLDTVIGGRYRLTTFVAEGAAGVVYRAQHIHLHKSFAVKLLKVDLACVDEVVRRFTREAEATSRLSHPNIVHVSDFGRSDSGTLFLVMEMVEGESLASLVARCGRLPPARALGIGRQILSALSHAHEHGVVHRDLKPDNVMIVAGQAQTDFVKLLDFGIAKISGLPPNEPSLTHAGLIVGTPWYMSPEQAKGTEADARSDIYAVGLILYEMLAGRRPFISPDAVKVLQMQIADRPPPLREIATDPTRSQSVDMAIARALEKTPANRFASARAFATALDNSTVTSAPTIRVAAPLPPRPLDRGLAHLALRAARVRTLALQTWRRLHRRVRLYTVTVGSASVVALIIALVAFDRPRPASIERAAPAAERDRSLDAIEEEIRSGRLPEARTRAVSAIASNPASGRARLLLGSIAFLDQRFASGLAAYAEALRIEPSLGSDAILLRNAASVAIDVRYSALALQVLEAAGTPACGYLASVALSEQRSAQQAARAACQRISCDPACPKPELRPRRHSENDPERGSLFGRFSR